MSCPENYSCLLLGLHCFLPYLVQSSPHTAGGIPLHTKSGPSLLCPKPYHGSHLTWSHPTFCCSPNGPSPHPPQGLCTSTPSAGLLFPDFQSSPHHPNPLQERPSLITLFKTARPPDLHPLTPSRRSVFFLTPGNTGSIKLSLAQFSVPLSK